MEEPTTPRSSQHQEPCGYPMDAEALISMWMDHIASPLYTISSIQKSDDHKTTLGTTQYEIIHPSSSLENETIEHINLTTPCPLDIDCIENANITSPLHLDDFGNVNLTSPLDITTIGHPHIGSIEDTNITSPLDIATTGASIFTARPPSVTPPSYQSSFSPMLTNSSLDHEIIAINDHITNSIIAANDESTPYDLMSHSLLVESLNTNTTTKESSKSKVWKSLTSICTPTHHKENTSIIDCIRRKTKSDEKQPLHLSVGTSPKSKPSLPPLRKQDKNKKTLVLDLDETLIHSSFRPLFEYDFLVQVLCENFTKEESIDVYVLIRPGLEDFLQKMSLKYELVVFTASTKPYADAILDQIDPKGLVKHRLYRDSCIFYDGALTKDLATLGRDLHKVIIVDNTPHCYSLQPNNAVPITSFIDNKEDTELIQLIPFLSLIAEFDDVTISLNAIPRDFSESEAFQRLQI